MAPSSLCTPQTPRAAKTRSDKEIAASDDSDSGFSNDSLEDLSILLGGTRSRQPPPAAQHAHALTPRAKRSAHAPLSSSHRSPLAIIPKHKFDLKALTQDARRDSALQASTRRAREPLRESAAAILSTPLGARHVIPGSAPSHSSSSSSSNNNNNNNNNTLTGIISAVADGGRDAQKVLRTVQRADAGHQELRYCFFDPAFETPRPSRPPQETRKAPWSLLAADTDRATEHNLAAGTLLTIVGIQGGMPDAVFLWLLGNICRAKSALVRTELCNLLAACPDQVTRLFAPDALDMIWADIGVKSVSVDDEEFPISKVGDNFYKDRDWSHLLSVLLLVQNVASSLPFETTKSAIKTLLRMAMDKVVISNLDIDNQYQRTLSALLDAVPQGEWDPLCFQVCSLLKKNFASQCIRVNALLCLPVSCRRAHSLRRRLAATFLFDDVSMARHPPEDVLSLQSVIERMDRPDFQVGPATEYAELRAAILVLDMAVDDGSVWTFADDDSEAVFNQRVDELARRLHEIWRRTNDAGLKLARTETKTVVEWVQKRVAHTVRTRRKRPKSIFDLPGQDRQMARHLPKQQEFMKTFFQRKQPATASLRPEVEREIEPEAVTNKEPELVGEGQQDEAGCQRDSKSEDVMDCIHVNLG